MPVPARKMDRILVNVLGTDMDLEEDIQYGLGRQ